MTITKDFLMEIHKRLEEMEATVKENEKIYQALLTELDEEKAKTHSLSLQLASMSIDLHSAEGQEVVLEEKVDDLEADLEDANREIEELEKKVEDLEEALEKAENMTMEPKFGRLVNILSGGERTLVVWARKYVIAELKVLNSPVRIPTKVDLEEIRQWKGVMLKLDEYLAREGGTR
jgi:predicted RNase H-like nuclease (RuvC/YqgF family)